MHQGSTHFHRHFFCRYVRLFSEIRDPFQGVVISKRHEHIERVFELSPEVNRRPVVLPRWLHVKNEVPREEILAKLLRRYFGINHDVRKGRGRVSDITGTAEPLDQFPNLSID